MVKIQEIQWTFLRIYKQHVKSNKKNDNLSLLKKYLKNKTFLLRDFRDLPRLYFLVDAYD